ncbi:MAG: four helix bundle protein [Chloroflexota bacterium]
MDIVLTNYEEWMKQVAEEIRIDPLWEMEVYRKALFFSDLAWNDCEKLILHPLGRSIAEQLIRSAGSVPSNMEEGYSRGFGKDYARFLRISLGSARESRGWYYRGRRLLSQEVLQHRFTLLKTIISGLVTMSNQQRNR